MIDFAVEADDFDEEEIENIFDNQLSNIIKSYLADKKDFNQISFSEKFNNFPSEHDLKFIKEVELPEVLDYCYPLLQKLVGENENAENLTTDIKIILEILDDLSKRNIPKEFSSGMLYYLIKHRYG